MVRNIVGVLVEIGQGKRMPSSIADLLVSRNRRKGSMTAPPQGLYLAFVEYPKSFHLPIQSDNLDISDSFRFLT